jgi:hypothetical protein
LLGYTYSKNKILLQSRAYYSEYKYLNYIIFTKDIFLSEYKILYYSKGASFPKKRNTFTKGISFSRSLCRAKYTNPFKRGDISLYPFNKGDICNTNHFTKGIFPLSIEIPSLKGISGIEIPLRRGHFHFSE